MASRGDLAIIKAARSGVPEAQLILGSRYFHGGNGLAKSSGTSFYWLSRAARQGVADAWKMIGQYFTYEVIKEIANPHEAAIWYEKAFDSGIVMAGRIFGRLVLENAEHFDPVTRSKAVAALTRLADTNDHHAQWLLARQSLPGVGELHALGPGLRQEQWIANAANAGIEEAQFAVVELAWNDGDINSFVQRATPLVEKIKARHTDVMAQIDRDTDITGIVVLLPRESQLLLRFATLLQGEHSVNLQESMRLLALSAVAGNEQACFELGLMHARLDRHGKRAFKQLGQANFKKALAWLNLAGEGGVVEAWLCLSRIYAGSIYVLRDLGVAHGYLQKAADLGLLEAQLELAHTLWRNRRHDRNGDVSALYWWIKAQEQGAQQVGELLERFAVSANDDVWARVALPYLSARLRNAHPFLAARIELAAAFGLSKPEALLIDVKNADFGHCLAVDICHYYARSKRRLVLVETQQQRMTLNRMGRLFSDVDSGYAGPEGNYRQRQYRLKSILPEVA